MGAFTVRFEVDPNEIGYCKTDNNSATITCYTGLSYSPYLFIHEMGHIFDSKSGLKTYMDSGVVIGDCSRVRVMGGFDDPTDITTSWTRGERGWGSGPARNGLSTTRMVTEFQQNATLLEFQRVVGTFENQALIANGIATPSLSGDTPGARGVRIEEAAADMFLNWVYRRLLQGLSPSFTIVCDPNITPTWNGPGFLNFSWFGGSNIGGLMTPISQPTERPGDIRYQWMDETIITIFQMRGW